MSGLVGSGLNGPLTNPARLSRSGRDGAGVDMALDRRGERQTDLMVGWAELPRSPGHFFSGISLPPRHRPDRPGRLPREDESRTRDD